jgi:hypothetical protein
MNDFQPTTKVIIVPTNNSVGSGVGVVGTKTHHVSKIIIPNKSSTTTTLVDVATTMQQHVIVQQSQSSSSIIQPSSITTVTGEWFVYSLHHHLSAIWRT